jgi:hypothetical protein
VSAKPFPLTTKLTLDDIEDEAARKKIKRHLNAKKRKTKLAGKVNVWERNKLNKAKGVDDDGGVPKRPGIKLKGTESNPSTIEKPYLEKQTTSYEKGKLTGHIAGSPVAVCALAEKAYSSGDTDHVDYIIDEKTGRAELAVGRITGKHTGREKGSLPTMLGGMESGDHKGHGIPEGGIDDPDLVNTLANLVPQDGTANVSHKKVFENFVIDYAEKNPHRTVHTIHERHYNEDDLRPLAETHYMVVDGKVVGAVTIGNPS